MKRWYDIKAASSGTHELLIYGDIGESWSDQSVVAADLVKDLAELEASAINVRINSYGGSVSDGVAIHNALDRHPAKINVYVDGVAVSIASLIAMAGEKIHMAENALMMIHAPWGAATGNAQDMRDAAGMLDRFAEAMLPPYSRRLGESLARSLITDGEDHWYTAEEALAAGLADEIDASLLAAAHFQLPSRFQRTGDTNMAEESPVEVPVSAQMQERNQYLQGIRAVNELPGTDPERRKRVLEAVALCELDPRLTRDECIERVTKAANPYEAEPLNVLPTQPQHQPVAIYGDNRHHAEYAEAATDAILLRAGIPVFEPHAAVDDVRGQTLTQIAQAMLSHSRGGFGVGFGGGNPNEIVRAAMTTSDFPILLANTANKAVMLGFENEPASHRLWTREVENSDFKPVSRYAISEAPGLEEIQEGGEYTHGSLSERSESYELKTYGKKLAITRKAIINDDIGGFTRIPQAFGSAAARLEADKVYALLTGNPAMSDGTALFHADHGNLASSGSALSLAALGEGRAAMRKQTGIGGTGLLNVVPRYLIVPAALESTAEQLLASLVDPAKQNDAANPAWVRGLELVVDPRLDSVSATGWYLAASHMQVDTVEVAHLAGQRGVFIEERSEFDTDNFEIKARLDFATQVIDWVGLYHNPGA